jgi:simple sugar transport system permease protein
MAFFISQSLFFIIPLLIVALAGMFSEKSGTVNIALEGLMVMGAFCGTFFISKMQDVGFLDGSPQFLLIISIVLAGLGGMIFSSLLAFLAINMRANQVIGGTALNLLAGALAIFLARQFQEDNVVQISYYKEVFRLDSDFLAETAPNINYIFFDQAYLTLYIGLAILIISTIVIYKTKFGSRLSACGEHPEAAQSVGIDVYKYRWMGVLISGLLGGIGGLVYALPISVSFEGTVAGYGFLALAVLIFGQWKPVRILFAAIFFGMFKALSFSFFNYPWITQMIDDYPNIPFPILFRILPYLATMLVLVLSSKKSKSPKAAGVPFDAKGK